MDMIREPIVHEMTIKQEYFDMILDGTKKYEVRTNDYRRKAMQIGDIIHMVEESEEKREIMLTITSKTEFDTFTNLYDALPKDEVGFRGKTTEYIVSQLRRFYTEEKERETGVVAIGISLVKNKTLEL